jgi:hypothetical protein
MWLLSSWSLHGIAQTHKHTHASQALSLSLYCLYRAGAYSPENRAPCAGADLECGPLLALDRGVGRRQPSISSSGWVAPERSWNQGSRGHTRLSGSASAGWDDMTRCVLSDVGGVRERGGWGVVGISTWHQDSKRCSPWLPKCPNISRFQLISGQSKGHGADTTQTVARRLLEVQQERCSGG